MKRRAIQRLWSEGPPQALFVFFREDTMATEPTPSTVDGLIPDPQIHNTDFNDSTYPSPLDCGDLAEIFRSDMLAAFHRLMTLTPTQLNLQALAYAAYLNQLHGLDLDMDDILPSWQRHIKHIRHIT